LLFCLLKNGKLLIQRNKSPPGLLQQMTSV